MSNKLPEGAKEIAVRYSESMDICGFATPAPGTDEVDVGDDQELVRGFFISYVDFQAMLEDMI